MVDKFERIKTHRNNLARSLDYARKKLEDSWATAESLEKAFNELKEEIDEYDRAIEILSKETH